METAGRALPSLRGLLVLIIILTGSLVAVLAVYYAQVPTTKIVQQQTGPFQLTIVEVMDTGWNSTIAQPKFSVLGQNGLESSSNIQLPAHRLIQLTIVSYDTPTMGGTDAEGKVSGTIGGTVLLINGTNAMGTDVPPQWNETVTSVPGDVLAHTFTIQQLGINIPVVGGDTTIAYLTLNQTGTFQWICLTPCGFGADGMEGAMSAPGWMEGQVTVS